MGTAWEWGTDLDAPRGILHIAHGMAEHGQRYEQFAHSMVRQGLIVVAPDHRGHGRNVGEGLVLGHFVDADGWNLAVEDLHTVRLELQARYPHLPYFMLGHSMGSMLLRDYLSRWGDGLAGAIIVGTGQWPGIVGEAGLMLARVSAAWRPRKRGWLLNRLAFAEYSKGFEGRTSRDWLSRDHRIVDAYLADPYCCFVPTNAFFRDLLTGLRRVSDDALAARVPAQLPILLTAGSDDPVGGSAAVEAVAQQYRRGGLQQLSVRVWAGMRHEILNEIGREEVYAAIGEWITQQLPGTSDRR